MGETVRSFLRAPLQVRWAIAMVLLCNALVLTTSIAVSTYQQHRWCGLLYAIESPQIHRPTKSGQQWQKQIHDFRTDTIGCR